MPPQSRACAQLLASPRRARCLSASGEEDHQEQHPGEPLAKRINTRRASGEEDQHQRYTQASPASDQVFAVHVLENAGKLLQEAGAGEGERLFVCVIRSLRSLFPRVCARLARCARFFFWCA